MNLELLKENKIMSTLSRPLVFKLIASTFFSSLVAVVDVVYKFNDGARNLDLNKIQGIKIDPGVDNSLFFINLCSQADTLQAVFPHGIPESCAQMSVEGLINSGIEGAAIGFIISASILSIQDLRQLSSQNRV